MYKFTVLTNRGQCHFLWKKEYCLNTGSFSFSFTTYFFMLLLFISIILSSLYFTVYSIFVCYLYCPCKLCLFPFYPIILIRSKQRISLVHITIKLLNLVFFFMNMEIQHRNNILV